MTNTPSAEALAATAAKQRRRGALSCAECRRLKLRCDRQFPCSSCRKRGCAAICPDGALTTGKGNRFILANTEELHTKISELQERIGQLEEGLFTAHASTSSGSSRHPLLTDELLAIKTPLGAEIVGHHGQNRHSTGSIHMRRAENEEDHSLKIEEDEEDVAGALGTLTIGARGTKFFGESAGSQFLLGQADEDDEDDKKATLDPTSASSTFSPQLSHLAQSMPFSTLKTDWRTLREELEQYLPPPTKAWQLCQNYFDNAAWLYQPMYRQYFIDHVFTPIYNPASLSSPTNHSSLPLDQSQTQKPESPQPPQTCSHHLAFLFIMFAIGSLMDLSKPPYNPEAEHYHMLARASFAAEGLVNNTLLGVQTLVLICYYNQLTDRKKGPDLAWSILGLAAKMATSIGLHRDPKGWTWNLDPIEAERRRLTFWELSTMDAFLAQSLGRPSNTVSALTDTQYPIDPGVIVDAMTGTTENSFCRHKYTFGKALVDILSEAFGVKKPKYDTILSIDRRLRDVEIPSHLEVPGLAEFGMSTAAPKPTDTAALICQQHTIFTVKESHILYLHRSYLAKALEENPEDPFASKYAVSVLAAHRSSCCVIMGVRNAFKRLPELMPRIHLFWVHAFTASIVLAAIVIRAPGSRLAPSSLAQLDIAYELFDQAKSGCRPARVLPILQQIQQKAHQVDAEFRAGKEVTPPRHEDDDGEDADLAMLGAKPRVVSAKKKSSASASVSSSNNPPQAAASPLSSDSPRPLTQEYVHPTLVEYLKSYNRALESQTQKNPNTPSSNAASPRSTHSYQQAELPPVYGGYSEPMPSLFATNQSPAQRSSGANVPRNNNGINFQFPSHPFTGNQSNYLAFEPMTMTGADSLNSDVLMGNGIGGFGQLSSTQDLDVTWQFMSDLGIAP